MSRPATRQLSRVEECTFQVWDLGGQANLRPSWATYYKHTDAVIVVVDSTDRARMNIAKVMTWSNAMIRSTHASLPTLSCEKTLLAIGPSPLAVPLPIVCEPLSFGRPGASPSLALMSLRTPFGGLHSHGAGSPSPSSIWDSGAGGGGGQAEAVS